MIKTSIIRWKNASVNKGQLEKDRETKKKIESKALKKLYSGLINSIKIAFNH